MKTETLTTSQTFFAKIAFEQTAKQVPSNTTSETTRRVIMNRLVIGATLFLLLGGAALVYYLQPQFYDFNESRINSPLGLAFLVATLTLLLFKVSFLIYNVYLYFQYKPIESVSDELLPTTTVIVPAYNEGKLVWQTLLSIANSDFPTSKLQILAIDDGSKDDTWYWMKKASTWQRRFPKWKNTLFYRRWMNGA